MISPFNRLVIRRFAKDRSDVRWFLATVRHHVASREAGGPGYSRNTRSIRLALGQYVLVSAVDHPAMTIVMPFLALGIYGYLAVSLVAGWLN